MIVLLLLLILLFLIGKSVIGAFFSVSGAALGLILILVVYFVRKRRQ